MQQYIQSHIYEAIIHARILCKLRLTTAVKAAI